MDNPNCTILGHPTGRIVGGRQAFDLDLERILGKARQRGSIMELNSQPERLDPDDVLCRAAKQAGVKVAITSDAHYAGSLNLVYYGLNQARRGWLEPADVVNTLGRQELQTIFRR